MKRVVGAALAVVVPLLLFLNVWQGYRYEQMRREVARLEEQQRAQLEENKRLVASIAVLSSPARIEKIAREDLGLQRIDPRRTQRVTVAPQTVPRSSADGTAVGEAGDAGGASR